MLSPPSYGCNDGSGEGGVGVGSYYDPKNMTTLISH